MVATFCVQHVIFSGVAQLLIPQSPILIAREESDFHFVTVHFLAIAKRSSVSFLA